MAETTQSRISTDDGADLHVERTGAGQPVLFIHEFAGDCRSWEPQVRAAGRQYECITYNARGYPPSSVPASPDAYSMQRAVADAVAVLDGVGVESAHVVGISMGGFTALHLGLDHPGRVRSLLVAGCGYGAQPERQEPFRHECAVIADSFEQEGTAQVATRYAIGPARVQFQNKDPRGWREFADQLAQHDALGAALTMRGVQRERPSLYALRERLARLAVPTLIVAGDEDEGCLEPGLMLKRTIPTAGLAILPRTGHTTNLEEPEAFNQLLFGFLHAVEQRAWHERDPRSLAKSTTGMDG